MYNKKLWKPSDKQKDELKSLVLHPGWSVIIDRAEHEHSENGKYLMSLLQSLDSKNPDDMLTLEKEWIKAEAVTGFLSTVNNFTQEVYSPE